MKNRVKKRRAARMSHRIRLDLVHAAGCTEPYCADKMWIEIPAIVDGVRNGPEGPFVSVPRSLRGMLGRWL